jgi:hypothetical protein
MRTTTASLTATIGRPIGPHAARALGAEAARRLMRHELVGVGDRMDPIDQRREDFIDRLIVQERHGVEVGELDRRRRNFPLADVCGDRERLALVEVDRCERGSRQLDAQRVRRDRDRDERGGRGDTDERTAEQLAGDEARFWRRDDRDFFDAARVANRPTARVP